MADNNNGRVKIKELEMWQKQLIRDITDIKTMLEKNAEVTYKNKDNLIRHESTIKIHTWLIGLIIGGVLSTAFFIIRGALK